MSAEKKLGDQIDVGNIGAGAAVAVGTHASVYQHIGDLVQIIMPTPELEQIGHRPAADPDAIPPYKGLNFFREEDAALYFGRSELISQIIVALKEHPFLAVVGASGSGKSSLLRAGVIPALRRGEQLANGIMPPANSQNWGIQLFTPGKNPIRSLAVAMGVGKTAVQIQQTELRLQQDQTIFPILIEERLQQKNQTHLLLLVDQFEELFTLCENTQEREQFVQLLVGGIESGKLNILLSLRADFYAACGEYASLRMLMTTNQKYVGRMSQEELAEAILAPLAKENWRIQEGLLEQILEDLGNEPGYLPLLSHALLESWKQRSDRTINLLSYRRVGGVRGAIAQTAETIYLELAPLQQEKAKEIFLQLVSVTADGTDTRRKVTVADLSFGVDKEAEKLINRLVAARLLRTAEDATLPIVELAHEALIQQWPRLQNWLDQNRNQLLLRRGLERAAKIWVDNDRHPDHLYRAVSLQQLDLNDRSEWNLSEQETTFLQMSRQEERRRLWQKIGSYTLITLFLVSLSYYLISSFVYPVYLRQLAKGERINFAAGKALLGGFDQLPLEEKELSTFALDRYEVTFLQYRLCVRAGQCVPDFAQSFFFDQPQFRVDAMAVVGVNGIQADQFCRWMGGRLPTIAEWERAVRGVNGRRWPWGEANPTAGQINIRLPSSQGPVQLEPQPATALLFLDGQSVEGVAHLIGNVAEWTATRSDTLCQNERYQCDPWQGETEVQALYVVGLSWEDDLFPDGANLFELWPVIPIDAHRNIGFRCAYADD